MADHHCHTTSMEAFRAAKRARLQKASAAAHHLCDASQAITLHLLRPGATSLADRAASFHPEFTHQWFPGTDEETEERIKGYEQLSIDLFLRQAISLRDSVPSALSTEGAVAGQQGSFSGLDDCSAARQS